MPKLVAPHVRYRRSFAEAIAEFRAEGRGAEFDRTVVGGYARTPEETWASDEAFAAFTAAVRAEALEETPRAAGIVPDTELWWVDGEEYLGRIAIRHRLTATLRLVGGHIGYDVRPSARRRGHATEMLRQALGVAARLGIERALVTCDIDNIGSRTVIERNGGVLAEERDGKRRYWIDTASRK
jgi:predicted acetyltransferase